jgi:nitrite reductase/ring-hydroxylating ferredoxin subunit
VSLLPRGTLLARLDALADPCAVVVDIEHEGRRISLILTRSGDAIAAFRNKCPHAGYPLQRADGRILIQEARYLVCAAHGASYAFDGQCVGGPCNGEALERVEIAVRDGAVVTAQEG